MELREFGLAFRRNWLLLVVCLLLGLVGPFLYNHYIPLSQASASVAVLDPLTARPAGYLQAQVTFDHVVESQALAAAVADRVGESPDRVHASLSVTLASSLASSNSTTVTSPVYVVHAQDRSLARAILIADTAVAEARKQYANLNSADGSAVLSSLSGPRAAADARVRSAQDALDKFVADHDAADLPNQIGTEQSLVSALQQQLYGAQSTAGSSAVTAASLRRAQDALGKFVADNGASELPSQIGAEQATIAALKANLSMAQGQLSADSAGAPAATVARDQAVVGSLTQDVAVEQGKLDHLQSLLPGYDRLSTGVQTAQAAAATQASGLQSVASLTQDLATERDRLDHLKSLLPEYERLSSDLQAAQGLANGLATEAQSMAMAQIVPPDSETKVVDPARPESQGPTSLLTYALGLVCGLILGLAAIYVAALIRPRPVTVPEVAEVFSAPVLVRISGRARR